MSITEILNEIPKLSADERAQVQAKLDQCDEWVDPDLTEADKAALTNALADYDKNPHEGHSWEEVEAYVRSQLRK